MTAALDTGATASQVQWKIWTDCPNMNHNVKVWVDSSNGNNNGITYRLWFLGTDSEPGQYEIVWDMDSISTEVDSAGDYIEHPVCTGETIKTYGESIYYTVIPFEMLKTYVEKPPGDGNH